MEDKSQQLIHIFSNSIPESWIALLSLNILQAPVSVWIVSLLIVMVFLFLASPARIIARAVIGRTAGRTLRGEGSEDLAGNLASLVRKIVLALGFYLAFLTLNRYWMLEADRVVGTVALVLFFWFFLILVRLSPRITRKLGDWLPIELVGWINRLIYWLVVFVAATAILELWGIDIGPVLAGLGLFGAAIALGAQNLFRNLIGGLLILAEKRFSVGDYIETDGGLSGTVQDIGFRSTVIKQLDSAPMFVPNDALADGVVRNLSRRIVRRIDWKVGLEYGTSSQQLTRIRQRILDFLHEDTAFTRPEKLQHFVRIDSFAASSIDVMVVCYIDSPDLENFFIQKERLVLEIMKIVEEEGASFAFPSQTLYVRNPEGGSLAPIQEANP